MTSIRVRWADDNLKRFGKDIERLQREFPKVLPQEINKVGDRAKTVVIRKLTKQTGLPRKTIVKAIGAPEKAKPGKLFYEMKTSGGQIRLKFFKPRETKAGVVARPFGQQKFFPKTFMKGGRFPKRVTVPVFHGDVYRNLGRGQRRDGTFGHRLTLVKSGVYIPKEMTAGATAEAFQAIAGPLLQKRVEKVIMKLLR
jgi:hypothetical protein